MSIFSNSSHFEWRAGLSDTILKGDHTRTIPAKFALIWVSGFRGEDLNVIFYQNMSNLYNQYKLVERKISQKNSEYMKCYGRGQVYHLQNMYNYTSQKYEMLWERTGVPSPKHV
jgi:hypothetical protein